MAFTVKSLYPDDNIEAIVTALLTVVTLKSFEYILKALLVSAGKERVSTSQYALSVAVDQAWNPLNYVSWIRARPDFHGKADVPKVRKGGRRIPLQRAAIAIMIMLLALVGEAAFFWGTQTKQVDLTDEHLRIAVNHTNENKGTKLTRNGCEPITLKEGRAHLKAIFATCSTDEGTIMPPGPVITAKKLRKDYAIGVGTSGAQNVTSWATFTLITQKDVNLVVRLFGKIHERPASEIIEYYKDNLKCDVKMSPNVTNVVLGNCQQRVDPFVPLQRIVAYVTAWQNGPEKDVGTPLGRHISKTTGEHKVGFIIRQNFTAIGILAITATLLVLAVLCHLFVSDDTPRVIACILHEKTGQDTATPTVAMGDGEVRIIRSFCEETQEWYIGTEVPAGYEERAP